MKEAGLKSVMVPVKVVLGETEVSVEKLSTIGEGTLIQLDTLAGEPVELIAAGERIARGEVVVIDENFGIRITQIVQEKGPGV